MRQIVEKHMDRMEQIAGLWVVGATAIAISVLFGLGLNAMFFVLTQAYLLFFLIIGVIVIPILVAMFLVPKDFLRKKGIEG